MIIRVTDKDLRDGIPNDPEHCALALAIKNLDPMAWVAVGHFVAHVVSPDRTEQSYLLNSKAREFVFEFDNGFMPIPQKLTLKPIQAAVARQYEEEN
jgi:hypothetical protein